VSAREGPQLSWVGSSRRWEAAVAACMRDAGGPRREAGVLVAARMPRVWLIRAGVDFGLVAVALFGCDEGVG
jgi:hypothetical protein